MGSGEVTRYIGKYGTKRVRKAVLIGTLGPYLVKAPDNPEGVDAKVFEDIKAAIRADRPAFLMEFLRNFYNYDVTGGKLVSERVLEDNWNVAVGASAIGTVACVDCWIEDFRKDIPKNNVPTLILHGDADRILPPDATSRRQAKMIKNVKFVELPGGRTACCGHTPTESSSELVDSCLTVAGHKATVNTVLPLVGFKLFVVFVLYLFVPLSALTYYFSRRKRRVIEVDRILSLLNVDPAYRKAYEQDTLNFLPLVRRLFVDRVGYRLDLAAVQPRMGLVNGEFPVVTIREVEFPQQGSRIVFAMAFFGVYFSVLQHSYRRYATTDLPPTIYYGSSIRICWLPYVALIIYNGYSALSGGGDSEGGITSTIWPALAF